MDVEAYVGAQGRAARVKEVRAQIDRLGIGDHARIDCGGVQRGQRIIIAPCLRNAAPGQQQAGEQRAAHQAIRSSEPSAATRR